MRVLISGSNSQLGKEFKNIITNSNDEFIFFNSQSLNLLDYNEIKNVIKEHNPDFIINFAAFTNVDQAEDDKELAFQINSDGPKFMSQAANDINSYFIHVSTDYVFGGKEEGPFLASSKTNPINIYGKSKLSGENNALTKNTKSIVIRTAGLFSKYNKNFVKNVTSRLLRGEKLKIVRDQNVSVTYAGDLAEAILSILNKESVNSIMKKQKNRIIHYTNSGYTSWFEVGEFIKNYLINIGIEVEEITPINSKEWRSKATRSKDTRLIIDYGLLDSLNIKFSDWKKRVPIIIDNELNRSHE